MANWGKRIKDIRERKNMAQTELASILGTNVRTIRRWENEESLPNVFEALRLCEALEVSIKDLFEEGFSGVV